MLARRKLIEGTLVAVLFGAGLALRLVLVEGYVFAGSDSYGYLRLADEWRVHHRYALGPAPTPLHFARLPLYPAFLVLVKGAARAEMTGGDGWSRIVRAQAVLDVALTGVLVWLLARRLRGPVAGVLALALMMFVPFTVIQCGAALSEVLATALTTATVAALVLLDGRPRLAFGVAGGCLALATLTRADGILAALAFVPALLLLPNWRARATAAASAGLVFALVFAPWPLRNLRQFGQPWLLGTRVDARQQPVLYWHGAHHFMQSYGRNWRDFNDGTRCMFDRFGCSAEELLAAGAVDAPDEPRLRALLLRHRADGLTATVDAGYEELARANFRHHPLRNLIVHPLARAIHMWSDAYDEIFQNPPWRRLYNWIRPGLPIFANILALALLISAIVTLVDGRTRATAAILSTAIFGRTLILAYTFYCMTRYVREVMPLAYVLIGCALAIGIEKLTQRLRREAAS